MTMSRSSTSSFNRNEELEQKLCFERLMEDIAALRIDLNKRREGKISEESRASEICEMLKRQLKEPPSYKKAQRELLLKEYVEKMRFVTDCLFKNTFQCKLCWFVFQDLMSWRNYALRYRLGKLKKKQSPDGQIVGPCEQPVKSEFSQNIELRLDTSSFEEEEEEEFPPKISIDNLIMMGLAVDDMARSGHIFPAGHRHRVVVENLNIIRNQNMMSKTEQKKLKKFQQMIQTSNPKDLKSIQRQVQIFNDTVSETFVMEQYTTSYFLPPQPHLPRGVTQVPIAFAVHPSQSLGQCNSYDKQHSHLY